MEHDDRLGKDESDILGGVDEVQDEPDFEQYLRNKEKEWSKLPISEMSVTRTPIPNADDAEENSSNEQSSETREHDESQLPDDARGVVGRATKLEIHKHTIVGSYITETAEAVKVDEEWLKIAKMTLEHPEKSREILIEQVLKQTFTTEFDTLKATPEQVISHYHQLERTIFLIRAQQSMLKGPILEELLKAETSTRRQELLELDRKYQTKARAKAKPEKSAGKSLKAKASTGKSKGAKTADVLKGLEMDKATVEKNLKTQGLLDESTQAYVNKLFA